MDSHKTLYKTQCSYNPRANNRINRVLLEANRYKQRRDRFQESRNLSPSPIRQKEEVIIPLRLDDKDDVTNSISKQQNTNKTCLAKIDSNATSQKKTKQATFLKRFVEWKEKKKNLKSQDINKKKPFLTAVSSSRQTTTSSSLVPRGHHKDFRPPTGLKNPLDNVKKGTNVKGRQSIYTVVPTPPRKELHGKGTSKFPIARKALSTNLDTKGMTSNKTPLAATNLTITAFKPKTDNKLSVKKFEGQKKSVVKKSPVAKSAAKVVAINLAKAFEKCKVTAKPTLAKPLLTKDVRPRALKMPPPSSFTTTVATGTNIQKGAIGKIRTVAQKRAEIVKPTKNSPKKRLAQTLKAKKPLNTSKKANVPTLQINGKKLVNSLNNKPDDNMIVQTPSDFFTPNPFNEFVTSTKIKDSFPHTESEDRKRSIDASLKKLHSNSSAKRNIMLDADITMQVKESVQNEEKTNNALRNANKKYNFIRYSETVDVNASDHMLTKKVAETTLAAEENKAEHAPSTSETTPPKIGPEERPANYLSPFVSVARGKVSLKKEKEKRNSVYLQDATKSHDMTGECTTQNTSPKYSVEIRRTLEAVRYFRKQLQDETDRLHKLCDVWEMYKKENLQKIQNANGEDMINVTIGQTRLLTSKKFIQFKGLIDRCESGATGIGMIEYDGSENTKPITSVDLEGFWSMLGLQVDNLDKRFDNLNRWKLNNWNDPDDVKPKIKKNLATVKKAKAAPISKAKPNSALQQMLRKMQAEMRKNKNKNVDAINGDVDTPSKLKQSSENSNNNLRKSLNTRTPRRISIVVKDRKYFSPAATVISILSPKETMNRTRSAEDSPNIIKHVQEFNEALDSMQSSLTLRKSVLLNENSKRKSLNPQSLIGRRSNDYTSLASTTGDNKENAISTEEPSSHTCVFSTSPQNSPVPTGRKSILKTPGTAKSKLHNVIFNEKLRVKKFNFLINEDDTGNANNTHEEDLAKSYEEDPQSNDIPPQRTLTLRNRKVRLRPSCEIVIPQ